MTHTCIRGFGCFIETVIFIILNFCVLNVIGLHTKSIIRRLFRNSKCKFILKNSILPHNSADR